MTTAYISHQDCSLHNMGPEHPESPIRLHAIQRVLERSGLIDQLLSLQAPHVEAEQIKRVHAELHQTRLEMKLPSEGVVYTDEDTALCPDSLHAASLSAGGAVLATDQVLSGQVKNAFVATRPPGHHAEFKAAMGFCFYNNVAIAAAHALAHEGIERVAILDFDVHHGNGTVDIFKDRPEVLVCSTFQHPFYPERYCEIDRPNIINCPLPAFSPASEWREAVETRWLPALEEHKPDMIFISAGFDAHKEDPMADLNLEEEDYRWVTEQLMAVANKHCNDRLVSVLEGGYNPIALAFSVLAHLEALSA
ncbi:histone deacetylase family protein [Marinobacterium mangrovicola]|uniref:Acetoin utilization deacetylase AcuC-like enzyme n=1 Tax=Marinobacterium mangrovicola TaxID=1476959 RepID=A0A4R1GLN0_9GAMM|nr:histone deacetylase family protein [Marinobacterium mangrovicola]TCK07029.1 acetoin utilization deacetylase AcuC-like enzyme [Marinobacterium mangrovicola]